MNKILTLDELIQKYSIVEGYTATRVLDDGQEQDGLLFKDNVGNDLFAIYGTTMQTDFGSLSDLWTTNRNKLRFVHSIVSDNNKNIDKWRIVLYANKKRGEQKEESVDAVLDEAITKTDNSVPACEDDTQNTESIVENISFDDTCNTSLDGKQEKDERGIKVTSSLESSSIVNKDYIGTVRERQGFLEYQKINIPQFYDILIEDMERIKNDEETIIFELQKRFVQDFPAIDFSDKKYSFVFPNTYHSTYITLPGSDNYRQGITVDYPQVLSDEEYREQENAAEIDDMIGYIETFPEESEIYQIVSRENMDLLIQNRTEGNVTEDYFRKVIGDVFYSIGASDDLAKKAKEAFLQERRFCRNKARKNDYYKKAAHFAYAHQYDYILRRISSVSDIKMYSTDQCGWKGFDYRIDDNISICVNTNFGFGGSSYFLCTLQYKGVDILPYYEYIQYYYANMQDMLKCTRRYKSVRSSWEYVFRFVVDTVNRAKSNLEDFEQNFILNEVKCLVEGLKSLLEAPKDLIVSIRGRYPDDRDGLIFVRKIDSLDVELYEVFPHEKLITDKVAKITGALGFLENLKKLSAFIHEITPYITEIKTMSNSVLPEIESLSKQVEEGIKQLQNEERYLESRITTIEQSLNQHVEKIVGLYKEKYHLDVNFSNVDLIERFTRADSVFSWEWGENKALEGEGMSYFENNYQCKSLVSECKELRLQLRKAKRHIFLRNNLLDDLRNSRNHIMSK